MVRTSQKNTAIKKAKLLVAVLFLCFSVIISTASYPIVFATGLAAYDFESGIIDGKFVSSFVNNSGDDVEGIFVIAMYDQKGALFSVKQELFTAAKDGGSVAAVIPVTNRDYPSGSFSFKAFCWDRYYTPLALDITKSIESLSYVASGAVVVGTDGVIYNETSRRFLVREDVKNFRFAVIVDGVGTTYSAAFDTNDGWSIDQEVDTMTIVRNTLSDESELRGAILPSTTYATLPSGTKLFIVTIKEGGVSK